MFFFVYSGAIIESGINLNTTTVYALQQRYFFFEAAMVAGSFALTAAFSSLFSPFKDSSLSIFSKMRI